MPRRYRLGIPALLITGVYVVALAVAAVIALTAGDLGALWRLTLFTEVSDSVAVTWPNVLILILAGLPWAWALWQSVRGPLAGPPPELDRNERRLRVALYAAAASSLLYAIAPAWPWWAAVIYAMVMWVVVLLFQPVLGRNLEFAEGARAAGVLAYGGIAAIEVLDVLDWPVPGWLAVICGVAGLIWTVLVLRAQRHDSRWHGATVVYGIAALVVPFVFPLVGLLFALAGRHISDDAAVAADALMMIWLARSAHELADPRHQPAPPSPLPAQPSTP
ncbi:hypothetical protein OHA25_49330 [Nonomuraea sp. NBC_00507]|uniref:hypothetical protein n=1 Tax=Nonomuraea sp. NBC_00507 TaxID=2976002 RepID=UPI002E185B92